MDHPAIALKARTKDFALRVIRLIRALPPGIEGRVIGGQVLRAATSVAANYRAVCRARSRADFVSKLGIVIEEAEKRHFGWNYWLNPTWYPPRSCVGYNPKRTNWLQFSARPERLPGGLEFNNQ